MPVPFLERGVMYLRREVSVKFSGESECNVLAIYSVTAFIQPNLSAVCAVYLICVHIFCVVCLMMAVVGDDGSNDAANE